jgi:ribosomal-protein-alanine N-acetyltransferase
MRVLEVADFEHYHKIMTDAEVMRYIGLEAGKLPTADEVRSILDSAIDAWKIRGYGRWSVFDRVTDEFVGFAGFRCEGGVPELIAIVHERFWGNGYASEAAQAVLDYGFSMLAFKVVCAFTRPENERARLLLYKLNAESVGQVDFHGVNGSAYRIYPTGK